MTSRWADNTVGAAREARPAAIKTARIDRVRHAIFIRRNITTKSRQAWQFTIIQLHNNVNNDGRLTNLVRHPEAGKSAALVPPATAVM